MHVKITSDDIIERSVDSRGRVRIGPDDFNSDVWVAVIQVADDEFELEIDEPTLVDVSADDVLERGADSRGRVRIGPKFAGKEVRVTVLRTADG